MNINYNKLNFIWAVRIECTLVYINNIYVVPIKTFKPFQQFSFHFLELILLHLQKLQTNKNICNCFLRDEIVKKFIQEIQTVFHHLLIVDNFIYKRIFGINFLGNRERKL